MWDQKRERWTWFYVKSKERVYFSNGHSKSYNAGGRKSMANRVNSRLSSPDLGSEWWSQDVHDRFQLQESSEAQFNLYQQAREQARDRRVLELNDCV